MQKATLHGDHNFSVIGPYNFLQWNLRFSCAPVQGHARPTWPGWPGWLNLYITLTLVITIFEFMLAYKKSD